MLAKEGLKIGLIYLSKPSATTSAGQIEGCKRYVLEDASEAAVKNLMQKIVTDYEKIFAFIHLEPNRGEKRTEPLEIKEDGENKLKAIFLMARDLKSRLMAITAETRPAFITVTQMDGKFGLNGYEGADPLPGGFAGLVKTLRLEWPNVFCRALDFHPSLEPRFVAEKIKDELFDADLRLSEVGYTPEGRFTIVLEEEVKQ